MPLIEYYDKKTSMELQSSTFSDTLIEDREDEDILQVVFNENHVATKDSLRSFEVDITCLHLSVSLIEFV